MENLNFQQNEPGYNKPDKIQAISIITLVSGIINIFWGIGLTITFVVTTLGFGLLCTPITILPCVLGIFEIIGAAKLMGSPAHKFNVQTIAILEIITIIFGNVFALVAGILNLVFYNETETKIYLSKLS
jgi:hypothetical protein